MEPSKLRFVTAASLFDGHDAAINIVRRILQSLGTEVIHLGHNRSAQGVVVAALQEDVHGIAISSYQGGHIEYFKYLVDLLKENDAQEIKIFGGGGGVILPAEREELEAYGVERIYSPEDGRKLGLRGMIRDMMTRAGLKNFPEHLTLQHRGGGEKVGLWLRERHFRNLARVISAIEGGVLPDKLYRDLRAQAALPKNKQIPVLGITGTGGAGKSSVVDELIRCFRTDNPNIKIAIIGLDPTKKKTGGALLGDRIRMNAIDSPDIYMRSMATRATHQEITESLKEVIWACKAASFDLILVETPGIGQGNSAIVPLVDASLYVMTPEFGAPTQLEKIDMLDFATWVAVNKFDRRGAEDALRDVRKQIQRCREAFDKTPEAMPVYGTIASRFNDEGILALYFGILDFLKEKGGSWDTKFSRPNTFHTLSHKALIPEHRQHYLGEIAKGVRDYSATVRAQSQIAHECEALELTKTLLKSGGKEELVESIENLERQKEATLSAESKKLLEEWKETRQRYAADEMITTIRDKAIHTQLYQKSLSHLKIPKVALPSYQDKGTLLTWLMKENLPGHFPYTAGVFHFKRHDEDPTRMFAGEGDAFRTNQRFKLLSEHAPAKRLSTAFDSVTLYGFDPDDRPDIYGKIGNSGVSIATLDDMKVLFSGFDLCDPKTSVSMTINGPAPIILAMFLNTAIDQQIDQFKSENMRDPTEEEYKKIEASTLKQVRGTVQADILKEDQGQNTCIFSTEFSLKLMGDVQEYFVQHHIKNFYSVSISGYHIAEAGANPISQLAFTLANAFTYVEAYLARGMHVDDFAANFSFFFSSGMDPEYAVIGRVARRIWATALRNHYGANARSQKLKYHIQTSGRSLHAQEMQFNDIRTTLEALIAYYDHCNSLHTNAYDEAITTPTAESVRRALAIQLIINREWGVAKNENPNQGSFVLEQLTDLVEEAVLQEFERINARGGVLGAMETGYQRAKIQEDSLEYESKKHDGCLPIVGVNTFINPNATDLVIMPNAVARSTEEEKKRQLSRLHDFHRRHADVAPSVLEELKQVVKANQNVFAYLMHAVRYGSLGQITQALFEVGGQYRRNM